MVFLKIARCQDQTLHESKGLLPYLALLRILRKLEICHIAEFSWLLWIKTEPIVFDGI